MGAFHHVASDDIRQFVKLFRTGEINLVVAYIRTMDDRLFNAVMRGIASARSTRKHHHKTSGELSVSVGNKRAFFQPAMKNYKRWSTQ